MLSVLSRFSLDQRMQTSAGICHIRGCHSEATEDRWHTVTQLGFAGTRRQLSWIRCGSEYPPLTRQWIFCMTNSWGLALFSYFPELAAYRWGHPWTSHFICEQLKRLMTFRFVFPVSSTRWLWSLSGKECIDYLTQHACPPAEPGDWIKPSSWHLAFSHKDGLSVCLLWWFNKIMQSLGRIIQMAVAITLLLLGSAMTVRKEHWETNYFF